MLNNSSGMEFINKTMVTISSPPPPSPPALNLSKLVEGGFLSGRNPLIFNPAAPLPTFIIQLLIIICMSRLVKFMLSPIRQPSVIAEIISGILLGPTVLGLIPGYTAMIFPKTSLPFLNLMSNFGLVLFLFLVGLELDPAMLRKSMKQCLSISLAGMVLPFSFGAAASYALYTLLEPEESKVSFVKYFLFLGVAMSITAFPVLARILTELNLLKTKVGSITISAAAVDDATSWCLLALVISLINAGTAAVALYVFVIGLAYTLFILLVLRHVYIWILRRTGSFQTEPSQAVICLTLLLVFGSAFLTDALGIHAIFGGFLIGIMVPHERGLAYKITKKLEDVVSVIFLPLYFALSGLKTHIGSLNDLTSWALVFLVIFVACAGKIVGCTGAAKLSKLSWRESITVGVLMNCKGLVELIVLNLGFDAGIISERTFAVMVIMALFTTFLTVPIVTHIYPPKFQEMASNDFGHRDSNLAAVAPLSKSNLMVCVNEVEQVPAIQRVINLLEFIETEKKPATPVLYDTKMGAGGSKIHLKNQGQPQMVVSALRLIEITERDSSIMIQTSPEAMWEDPVLKMLGAFGQISCLDIQGLVQVVTATNFGGTILRSAAEVEASFIVIPWAGNLPQNQGNVMTRRASLIRPSQQQQQQQQMMGSQSTTTKYAEFMQEILRAKTSPTVLILVASDWAAGESRLKNEAGGGGGGGAATASPPRERQLSVNGLVSSYQKICLLYFGGGDDEHALQVVMASAAAVGGSQQEISVNIIRFKVSPPLRQSVPKNDEINDRRSTSSSPSPQILNGFPLVSIIGKDPADIFDQFSNHNGPATMRNVTYTEIETNNPVPSVIDCVKGLDHNCLVIVGRTHELDTRGEGAAVLRNADVERRKILGDVAESIILSASSASVLVVQAGSTNGGE